MLLIAAKHRVEEKTFIVWDFLGLPSGHLLLLRRIKPLTATLNYAIDLAHDSLLPCEVFSREIDSDYSTPPAFPFRDLYSSQPRFHGFRLPDNGSKLGSHAICIVLLQAFNTPII